MASFAPLPATLAPLPTMPSLLSSAWQARQPGLSYIGRNGAPVGVYLAHRAGADQTYTDLVVDTPLSRAMTYHPTDPGYSTQVLHTLILRKLAQWGVTGRSDNRPLA